MTDVVEIWKQALPVVRNGVTGVGVWAALNSCKPILFEDGVFVLGTPSESGELAGHLKIPSTKRLIEITVSKVMGQNVSVRIIEGDSASDWELVKRRDGERRKLQEQEMTKMRAELSARTSWDSVYEQLSRRFAAVANKSLPQNRARFFAEAVALVAEARQSMNAYDDAAERSFARCIERVAQYSEVPSSIVGMHVLQLAGEI